ncbi:phosphatase PAP2 family protein [Rouxiella sp. WC2420]|uniref:Acid phosphatase n=1 Tax=Rouxiella sp. WC2420 TaxID=3234145 RepID=A0AB39VMS8_9GAMM
MKKLTSALLISLVLTGYAHSADKHYLTLQDTADSMQLLPPPPAFDSVAFLADKAAYEQGKYLRNTPRGEIAYSDADSTADNVTKNFSKPFGFDIDAKNTPATYELISTMKEDAGDYATKSAKEKYNRIRPFAFFHEPTCRPEDESKLAKNGSYPSGHTAIGWSIALVLAEINPQRQNEILKRGFELGQSRVICGYHWQSDVDAARVVSSAVVARLHSNPQFVSQLEKAKEEISKMQSANK